MYVIDKKELLKWCSIPVDKLAGNGPRVPFEVVRTERLWAG